MTEQPRPSGAVFLSYASQDAEAATRICESLRAAGVEVWLDKSELRGGDAWDSQIKKQIHDCALFVPVISAHTNARSEGYFRREWKQATRRLQDMADDVAFLVPVVVDDTREAEARVPEEFFQAHWTWLPGGETPPEFAQRVRQLLGLDPAPAPKAKASATAVLEPSERRHSSVRPRGTPLMRRFGIPLLVLLLVLGGGALLYLQGVGNTPSAKPATAMAAVAVNDKSIAVLPFADMSAERDQEYFADGIAEELLNLLAQVPDLKVIARTSSFAFKGEKIEISEIAKKLNVAHVVEGSLRKSGNKLRITVQLVRTADSTHLWSETYDRPLDDIFAVQDEIAGAIVQALQIKLMGGTLSRREGGTQNLEAYQLYLRAVSVLYQNTKASLDTAAGYAEQATKLDPSYGRAWSTLAYIVETQADNGFLPATEGFERARQLSLHALQLSPDLADAHAGLAYVYQVLDWNLAAAEIEIRQALAIDPTHAEALHSAGLLASTKGQWDEAERYFREALDRDPLNMFVMFNLGASYYLAGRLGEAERVFREVLKREQGFLWTRRWLAKTLLAQGKPEAALAMIKTEVDDANRMAIIPIILQANGRDAEADEALKALIERWGDTWPYNVAETYAYRGNHDLALHWLERAYTQNDASLTSIVGEPLFKSMANDPRYKAFLRKLNLPS